MFFSSFNVRPRVKLVTRVRDYTYFLFGWCFEFGSERITSQMESRLAQLFGFRYSVMCGTGRGAWFLGLLALERKGTLLATAITVPEMIDLAILAGFKIKLLDIESTNWNVSSSCEYLDSALDDDVVGIIYTDYFGYSGSGEIVQRFCEEKSIYFLEDAAQSLGLVDDCKHPSHASPFTIVSFSFPKLVTSFFGGVLLTNSEEIALTARAGVKQRSIPVKLKTALRVAYCFTIDIITSKLVFPLVFKVIQFGPGVLEQKIRPPMSASRLEKVPDLYICKVAGWQVRCIGSQLTSLGDDVLRRQRLSDIYKHILGDACGFLPGSSRESNFAYFPVLVDDAHRIKWKLISAGYDVAALHIPIDVIEKKSDLVALHQPLDNTKKALIGTLMLPTHSGVDSKYVGALARELRDIIVREKILNS